MAPDKVYVAFDACGNPFAVSPQNEFSYMEADRVIEYHRGEEVGSPMDAEVKLSNTVSRIYTALFEGMAYTAQEDEYKPCADVLTKILEYSLKQKIRAAILDKLLPANQSS